MVTPGDTTNTATTLDMTIKSFVLDNLDDQIMIIDVQISMEASDLCFPMQKLGHCVSMYLEKISARITICITCKTLHGLLDIRISGLMHQRVETVVLQLGSIAMETFIVLPALLQELTHTTWNFGIECTSNLSF